MTTEQLYAVRKTGVPLSLAVINLNQVELVRTAYRFIGVRYKVEPSMLCDRYDDQGRPMPDEQYKVSDGQFAGQLVFSIVFADEKMQKEKNPTKIFVCGATADAAEAAFVRSHFRLFHFDCVGIDVMTMDEYTARLAAAEQAPDVTYTVIQAGIGIGVRRGLTDIEAIEYIYNAARCTPQFSPTMLSIADADGPGTHEEQVKTDDGLFVFNVWYPTCLSQQHELTSYKAYGINLEEAQKEYMRKAFALKRMYDRNKFTVMTDADYDALERGKNEVE